MVTEVKLEDLERKYKDIAFAQRMDFEYGGKWKDKPSEELEDIRNRAKDTLTDDWTNLLTASTIGDEENGRFKVNHAAFIIRGVRLGQILVSDVYKYKEYLEIFNKNKNLYAEKDLGKFRDRGDYNYFANQTLRIKRQMEDDPSQQKGIDKAEKYKDLFVMKHDGYSMYMIPQRKDMEKDEKFYYNASCELGSGTEWCTATGNTQDWFNQYSKDGPLFIFIPEGGGKQKFQYAPVSGEFRDSRDFSVYTNKELLEKIKGWKPFFDKIKGFTGGDMLLSMAIGAPPNEVKEDFKFYFTTDEEYMDRVFEIGPEPYMREVEKGDWDNDKIVQTFFSREQLDPYNGNNWLKLLTKGYKTYLHLTYPENIRETMAALFEDYGFGRLDIDPTTIEPYEEVFYETVIKPAIQGYMELEYYSKQFNYEGELAKILSR